MFNLSLIFIYEIRMRFYAVYSADKIYVYEKQIGGIFMVMDIFSA